MTHNLSRRAALGGILAVPFAGAAAAMMIEPDPSPILTLFREWDALFKCGFVGDDRSDRALDEYCDRLRDLETQIVALPARTAAEFAAKVIAVTNHGDYHLSDGNGHDLLAEGVALIGRAQS